MGNAAYKQRHKEQGLCRDCSRPALPMRLHCIIHNEHYRKYIKDKNKIPEIHAILLESSRKLKEKYRKTNRCPKCSAPLGEQDKGYVTCINCRIRLHSGYSHIAGVLLEDYYKKVAVQS